MISIIIAAILGGSLYLSANGVLWATNVIIVMLSLNVFMIVLSSSVVAGMQRSMLLNAENRIKQLDETLSKTNVPVLFLTRLFLVVCVWHLYTLGYLFFAGIAATTVSMSLLVLLFRSFDVPAKEGE